MGLTRVEGTVSKGGGRCCKKERDRINVRRIHFKIQVT